VETLQAPAGEPGLADQDVRRAEPDLGLQTALDLVLAAAGASGAAVAWHEASGSICVAAAGDGAALEPAAAKLLMSGGEGGASLLSIPLHAERDRAFGVLVLDVPPADPRPIVLAAARHVAGLLEGSRVDAERTAAYEALVEVSSQIHAQELNTDGILALITHQARRLMGVDVTWLALFDEERNRVVVKVASGATTEGFVRMWVSVGVGVGGLAIRDRRPVAVRDHRRFDHPTTDLVNRTLEAEGVVSLLCVPMLFEGRAVGVLYGGSRTPTDFTETAVSVFTALAGQAAVSIVNSRLYRDLATKNDTLERAFALQRSLSEAALSGGGMEGIAGELTRIIACPVEVRRTESATKAPCHDVVADERCVAIKAGTERLGSIRAEGTGPLTDLEHTGLQQAATVMALEIMKERATLEAEWRLRGELLEEMLQADGDWSDRLLLRSERFGIDLDRRRCLAVIEMLEPHEQRDLQLLVRSTFHRDLGDGTALVSKRGDRVLVALALEVEAAASAVQTLLDKAAKGGLVAVAGLSTPRRNLTVALKEADAAVALAHAAGAGTLVSHDSLGPLRFLLDAPDTGEMVAMVRSLLGPISAYDASRGGGEILGTLRAYLELGNRPAVAERCHIHVSTVKYRMGKAAELLGRPLTEPQTRFEIRLAFAVLDVLKTLGVDPLHD
jgi:DNA-binding PucR family transcriptional regulator